MSAIRQLSNSYTPFSIGNTPPTELHLPTTHRNPMPTNLDRIQTLLQPEAYAKVRTLAKHNRRAMSAMSAELVEEALKLPKYRQQIEDADIQVPAKEDPREAQRQVAITPKTMRESHFKSAAEKVAEIAAPTTKPRLDHKGYLMKDEYGNVLIENTSENQAKLDQADALMKEEIEKRKTSDDVDARLKKMEEMIAQMAAMMQPKV